MASSKSHKQSRLAQMLADPSDKHHGTTTGYGYGCRCGRCVKAKSDYTARVKESMTDEDIARKRQQRRSGILKHREELLRNPDDPRHGSKTGYDYGCRCDRCKAAKSDAYVKLARASVEAWVRRHERIPVPAGLPEERAIPFFSNPFP